ncbi:MAG: hypothetical protein AMXMBFR7_52340 [Planctomycetota bacterium]
MAWHQLNEKPRLFLEVVLQEIHAFAQGERLLTLIEEAHLHGIELPQEFHELPSKQDKALWIWAHYAEVWKRAVHFVQADAFSEGRFWQRHTNLPMVKPNEADPDLVEFGRALSFYYRKEQGRGGRVSVDHLCRRQNLDYYFVYLSDYPRVGIEIDEANRIQRNPQRKVFEVVFAYDRKKGSLEFYSRGGKKIAEAHRSIFCRMLLNVSIPPAYCTRPAYQLNGLLVNQDLSTDPEDEIQAVYIRDLRLLELGRKRMGVTLHADLEQGYRNIHDRVRQYLQKHRLHPSLVNVSRAVFGLEVLREGKRRTITFTVSLPNNCDLKSKREEFRELGEKYLRKWGLYASDHT